ncbi:MAG: hypothetical protein ACK527_11990 [Acidobacteriota bacterium]
MQKSFPLSGWILLLPGCLWAQGELKKAAEEFKTATRELGLRADSPARAAGGKRQYPWRTWHGRVFYNLRNDVLDAVPHEIAQRGGGKNRLRRGQFGFSVAGPVIGKSTFASLSYEGVRERIGRNSLRTIAILPERRGDFSRTVDSAGEPLQVFDPGTTRPNPDFDPTRPVSTSNLESIRQPFPNSQIPNSRLDPVALRGVSLYPLPNADAGPFFRNNYFVVSPETNQADGLIFKLDHTVDDKNRLSFAASTTNGLAAASRLMPTIADPGSNDRLYSARRGTLEHILTLGPRTINTLTLDLSTDRSDSQRPGEVFPLYSFSGTYLGMGRPYPVQLSAHNTYSLSNGYSTRLGKHSLRASGSFTHYQVHAFLPPYPRGRFTFGPGYTSLPGINNTGHAFASFLLGAAEYAEASVFPSPSYWRRHLASVSVRDQYEVNKRLNLTIGASMDLSTPRTEKYNRLSTVRLDALNPANGRPGALAAGGAAQPVRIRPSASVSFAWNPTANPKSVVRGSAGLSYQAVPVYTSQWGTQGFNGTPTAISRNTQLAPAILLRDGLPALDRPLPDLRPDFANNTVADLVEPTATQPFYQSGSLSYERELPGQLILAGTFGHSRGQRLFVSNSAANPNAIPLSNLRFRDALNNELFRRELRPYPQFQRFDVYSAWPLGNYRRNAGSLRVEKRSTSGLGLTATYEVSRQMDDYSGPYGVQDFYNRRAEWALTAYNIPQRLSLSYAYELPIGSKKSLLAYNDWRRYLIDGWSISGMTTLLSGEPIALRPQFNNTGALVEALRVNVVPGVNPSLPKRSPELWFNPAAFDNPENFTLGDGPRTHPTLRNPPSQNHDLSVTKRIAIDAERALELQATGFNFVNTANWTDPDPVIGPASTPNVNAGRIIGSRGGRVIQVGLRLSF